jgi:acyl-coenzyme A thioesterase PaaI-like protein
VDPPITGEPITVEQINETVREGYPGMRNRCIEIGDDYAIAAYDVDESDIRPGGFISGPSQFMVADGALWFMAFVALGRIEPMALTSELSLRFLRPAQGERLICRARLESVSRRSIVGTCHTWVDGAPDRVTSIAQGTYAVPLPR